MVLNIPQRELIFSHNLNFGTQPGMRIIHIPVPEKDTGGERWD